MAVVFSKSSLSLVVARPAIDDPNPPAPELIEFTNTVELIAEVDRSSRSSTGSKAGLA